MLNILLYVATRNIKSATDQTYFIDSLGDYIEQRIHNHFEKLNEQIDELSIFCPNYNTDQMSDGDVEVLGNLIRNFDMTKSISRPVIDPYTYFQNPFVVLEKIKEAKNGIKHMKKLISNYEKLTKHLKVQLKTETPNAYYLAVDSFLKELESNVKSIQIASDIMNEARHSQLEEKLKREQFHYDLVSFLEGDTLTIDLFCDFLISMGANDINKIDELRKSGAQIKITDNEKYEVVF